MLFSFTVCEEKKWGSERQNTEICIYFFPSNLLLFVARSIEISQKSQRLI